MPASPVRFPAPGGLIESLVGVLTPHVAAKLERVKRKLEAERGRAIDEREFFDALMDNALGRAGNGAVAGAGPAACGLANRRREPAAEVAGENCPVRGIDRLEDFPAEVDADWWRRHVMEERREVGTMCQLRSAAPLARLARDDPAVESLTLAARVAAAHGRPLGHVLLCGPPGAARPMLARGLAGELGSSPHFTESALVPGPLGLLNLLAGLGRHDVLFIEEVHLLPPPVMSALREALSGFRLNLSFISPAGTRAVLLRLAPFTLIGGTAHPGLLPQGFLSRFEHLEYLGAPTAAPGGASPARSRSA